MTKQKQSLCAQTQRENYLRIQLSFEAFSVYPPSVSNCVRCAVSCVFRATVYLGGVYLLSFFLHVVHRNIPHFFFFIKAPEKIVLDHPFSYLLYKLIFSTVSPRTLCRPLSANHLVHWFSPYIIETISHFLLVRFPFVPLL